MARWTKEQQILIDIGRREFKQEVVGIIKKYGFHIDVIEYKKMIKEIESK